ncbi:MAG TPA: LysM peptidoglycan-binding domain-containing protein [Isosphaeraceae bacterium]|jgi:nucleoid-associated protein YgaU|nr:LysM peptidoglycan-binding domain-containing protein [Isosphaeraceae bacterium]
MSEHHHSHDADNRQDDVNNGHAHEHGHEHSHEHEGNKPARGPFFLLGGLKRETRAGIAILFSFVILTAVLVGNKRNKVEPTSAKEGAPKVAAANGKGAPGSTKKEKPKNTAIVTAIAPRSIKKADPPASGSRKGGPRKSEHPSTAIAKHQREGTEESQDDGKPTPPPLVTSALPDSVNRTANSEPPRLPPLGSPENEPDPLSALDLPPPSESQLRADPPEVAGGIVLPHTPSNPTATTTPTEPPPTLELQGSGRMVSRVVEKVRERQPRDPLPAPEPSGPEPVAETTPRQGSTRGTTAGRSHSEPLATTLEPGSNEPAPPSALPASAFPSSMPTASGSQQDESGWVTLPNVGKATRVSPDAADRQLAFNAPNGKPAPTAAEPVDDAIDPVEHVVQSGENFWSISQLYYGSGRYYKALWAANRDRVAAPDKLRVTQSIRVPPPEALDRSLIVSSSTPSDATSRSGRTSSRAGSARDVEVTLPVGSPSAGPARSRKVVAETTNDADYPHYQVRPHDTLRTIARDTLGDSHRSDEILEMNRDTITDPHRLTAGQTLILPEDARVGRRTR